MKSLRHSLLALASASLLSNASIAPTMAAVSQYSFERTYWHEYMNDFNVFTSGDWTITRVGTTPTEALINSTNDGGGLLRITISAADDDSDFLQLKSEGYKWASGTTLYCAARFKVSDATQSDWVWGLQITDTTPLAVTDGIFFQKDDGDANIDFHVEKNSTSSDATALATMANDTYVKLAFYYDPGTPDRIQYLVNDVVVGSLPVTNVVDDEELAVSFGLQNGEAVAKNMTVDYVFCTQSR